MSVAEDVKTLSLAFAELRGRINVWGTVLSFVATAAVGLGGGALVWASHISSRVAVLESGGNPKLVSESLLTPQSNQQLSAKLSSITAQVQQEQAGGRKADAAKLQTLSRAVNKVITRNPDLPEAWGAASALVDFRPAPAISALPPGLIVPYTEPQSRDCYQSPPPPSRRDGAAMPNPALVYNEDILHDCTLRIDDVTDFEHSTIVAVNKEEFPYTPRIIHLLTLVRVRVVYSGQPLIPVSAIRAYGCTFEFSVFSRPPGGGQTLVQAVLDQPVSGGELEVSFPASSNSGQVAALTPLRGFKSR